MHLFVKLYAHLENFPEIFLILVQQLVQLPVADQNHLHIDLDRFRLQRAPPKRIKHFQRLNLQAVVIQRAFQRPPHPHLAQRLHGIHDQESAVGPQQRSGAQIHEVAGPPATRVVSPLNRPKQIGISGRSLEDHRRAILIAMRQDHIDAINAKRIALLRSRWFRSTVRRRLGPFLLPFSFALLKRIEIVQQVVPHLLQVFSHARARIFLLQLLNHAVHQHRSCFLLQITQFARQLPRKRQRLPVNHRKFLPKLFVLPLDLLRHRRIQFPLMHHFRNIFNRYHLPFEYRKNLWQRHCSHLHVPQRKLLARNPPREIGHQLFLTHGKTLDNPPLLPLEGLALEYLRNPPPQKINARLHILLKRIRLPARQRKQSRPVRNLEIIYVAAVQRSLGLRMQLFNHVRNRSAAAGPRQPAHKYVVSRRRKLHAHLQRPQRTFLSDETFAQFRLCRRLKRQSRRLTPPPQLFRRQLRMHSSGLVAINNHLSRVL